MKSLLITSILTLLTFQLYAYDSEELNADVNTVAKVISEDSRNSVVLFLVHGDSGISGKNRMAVMIAKNAINGMKREGVEHDALIRLLGRMMSKDDAAIDSRRYAYSRLRAFSDKSSLAKKEIEDAKSIILSRDDDPMKPTIEK